MAIASGPMISIRYILEEDKFSSLKAIFSQKEMQQQELIEEEEEWEE